MDLRCQIGFEVSYAADGDLAQAITEHLEYISGEVLALEFVQEGAGHAHQSEVGEFAVQFSIERVEQA